MSLSVGQSIGRYRIEEEIGAGGMGVVYRAYDEKLERDLAIKVLLPGTLEDPVARKRFRQEAKILSRLNHPSIQIIHDFDTIDGHDLLVSELVQGISLDTRLEKGPLPEKEVIRLGIQLADGLMTAHAEGILHRDLKPANLRLTPDGRLKILDFGLATLTREAVLTLNTTRSLTTPSSEIAGTVPYMSPEQLLADNVDERSDLYSAGVVLFELATARMPFEEETVTTLISLILRQPAPEPRELNPNVSFELQRIILKCLEKDRELRYQSATELSTDLRRIEQNSSEMVFKALPVVQPRRKPVVPIIAASALIALVVALGVVALRNWGATPSKLVALRWEQLTHYNDMAQAPALSPDGRTIAFIRGQTDYGFGNSLTGGQVWVKALESDATQLTKTPLRKQTLAFSRDGSHVFFTQGGSRFTWDTYSVPLLGAEEPKMFLPNATGLSWIGENRLLYSTITHGVHMKLVTSNGSRTDLRELYVPEDQRYGMVHRAALSPDGKWILAAEMDSVGWMPCRLIPFDGSNAGHSVGPAGACTWAQWSRDGRWMFFTAYANGNGFHIWRQRFPDGKAEQVTPAGASEEEGLAMMPDGKSLITSVGLEQSVIWVHDQKGDRALTNEGFAFSPALSPDGKTIYYLRRGGNSRAFVSGELWKLDIASGNQEQVFPGVALSHFAISHDGKRVVYATAGGLETGAGIWIADLDRTQPPKQLTNSGEYRVFFGAGDEIVYLSTGNPPLLMRMRRDGSNRQVIAKDEVGHLMSISPDGQWVIAGVLPEGSHGDSNAIVKAYRVDGSESSLVCDTCKVGFGPSRLFSPLASWSPDGRWMYYALRYYTVSQKTVAIPIRPGAPPPAEMRSIANEEEVGKIPGARLIDQDNVCPWTSPEVYVYSRKTSTANLFRIYFEE